MAVVRPTMGEDSTGGEERHVCQVCGEEFESEADREDHLFSVGLVY